MVVIFGTRLFGGTDTVPGVFHVATKFFHIDFVPLIPLGSYVVLEQNFGSFQGVPIPVNTKSMFIAWIRAIGWICVVASFIWTVLIATDGNTAPRLAGAIPALGVSGLVTYQLMCHKYLRNASYERATEICLLLGPNGAAAQRLVDAHFDRANVGTAVAEEEDEEMEIPSKAGTMT